jgi:hypothetical protein
MSRWWTYIHRLQVTIIYYIGALKYVAYIEGIMPEGRINKITDLKETKFLPLFDLTDVHY